MVPGGMAAPSGIDLAADKGVQAIWTAIRPGYMIALFLVGWAANVVIFSSFRIDYGFALGISKEEILNPPRLIALAATIMVLLSFFRSVVFVQGPSPELLLFLLSTYIFLLFALFSTLPEALAKLTRWRGPLTKALWRCIWPDSNKEVPFVEVLVADGLTSLAKLFFDLTLGTCVVVRSYSFTLYSTRSNAFSKLTSPDLPGVPGSLSQSHLDPALELSSPRRLLGDALDQCNQSPLPFIFWFLPFLIRARQCWVSSRHAPDNLSRDLHRVNLLKYISALPVVFFAMCHANALPGISSSLLSPDDFEAMWAMAGVVNAVFSFFWDLNMDWGLLQPGTVPFRSSHFGLRPVLLYKGLPGFYHSLIVLNLLGRMLWSLRWSEQATVFMGAFFLSSFQQAAEVVRRCLWIMLRVEWECIKKGVKVEKNFPV